MSWATKYRPLKFDSVVGQVDAIRLLKRSAYADSRQCVLLAGPYGTGKTTLARIYATELGAPPWSSQYTELDAATHSGVDAVRELLGQAQYAFGSTQVIVIDEAHALSTAAQQAFLIAIEEGSPADFVFCTSQPTQLSPALRSRLLPCYLQGLNTPEIAERLAEIAQEEGVLYDASGATKLASRAQGHLRDAITALEALQSGLETDVDRYLGLDTQERLVEAVACTCEERIQKVRDLLTELAPRDLSERMATLIVESHMANAGVSDGPLTDTQREQYVRVIKHLDSTNPFGVAKRLFEIRDDLPDLHYGVAAICYAFEHMEMKHAPAPIQESSVLPRKPGT